MKPSSPSRSASRKQPDSAAFTQDLCAWYAREKRALPWRGETNPYRVWVSESMLQQTRIETVIGYYARFLEKFPSVQALAAAPVDDVLKCWEGLGYYSRARNLQKAARQIVAQGGSFPSSAEGWKALPGIGPYTAAALASICNGIPEPVVDGNVTRVCLRLQAAPRFAKDPSLRTELSQWLRPRIRLSENPGDFNEALMELGETVCTPTAPQCLRCPLQTHCRAFDCGRPEEFPRKAPPIPVPVRRYAAFLIRRAGNPSLFLLRQRPQSGLLAGLWELPMCALETVRKPGIATAEKRLAELLPLPEKIPLRFHARREHKFTHFTQILYIFTLRPLSPEDLPATLPGSFAWQDPATAAIATASRKELIK